MVQIQTDQRLLDKLSKASKEALSEKEIQSQRLSFVLGAIGSASGITKEKAEQILAKHEGRAK